jgi:hypothetical protein
MSLAVAAMQICAVKALDGQVQAKVFDSAADPRDLENAPLPIVIVYSALGRRRVEGRELFTSPHKVDLVLDLGVARQGSRTTGEGDAQVTVEFPATDSSYDIVLHTLDYECARILLQSKAPWADLFRQFVWNFAQDEESGWSRGQLADSGVRLALIRQVYRIDVLGDPIPGAPLTKVWSDFLAAMDADPECSDISKYWRALITSPTVPEWQQEQAQLGLTLAAMYALGQAPTSQTTDDPLPLSTEIDIKFPDEPSEIIVDPSHATITEGSSSPTKFVENSAD